MPIYMRISYKNGGLLNGEVSTKGYAGWIEVDSWSPGAGVNINYGGGGGTAGNPGEVKNFVVIKAVDKVSAKLHMAVISSELFKIEIAALKAGNSAPYWSATCTDAFVHSVRYSGSGKEEIMIGCQTMTGAGGDISTIAAGGWIMSFQ